MTIGPDLKISNLTLEPKFIFCEETFCIQVISTIVRQIVSIFCFIVLVQFNFNLEFFDNHYSQKRHSHLSRVLKLIGRYQCNGIFCNVFIFSFWLLTLPLPICFDGWRSYFGERWYAEFEICRPSLGNTFFNSLLNFLLLWSSSWLEYLLWEFPIHLARLCCRGVAGVIL